MGMLRSAKDKVQVFHLIISPVFDFFLDNIKSSLRTLKSGKNFSVTIHRCRMLSSLEYIVSIFSEWENTPYFLDVWSHLNEIGEDPDVLKPFCVTLSGHYKDVLKWIIEDSFVLYWKPVVDGVNALGVNLDILKENLPVKLCLVAVSKIAKEIDVR